MARMEQLEKRVKSEVEAGTFESFAYDVTAAGVRRREHLGLWIAVSNAMTSIRNAAMDEAYGHEPGYQLHGLAALSPGKTVLINKTILPQLEPYRTAHTYLQTLRGKQK